MQFSLNDEVGSVPQYTAINAEHILKDAQPEFFFQSIQSA